MANEFMPAGHYYSPTTHENDRRRAIEIARQERLPQLPGIEIRNDKMIDLWNSMVPSMTNMPYPDELDDGEWFYYYKNNMYSYGDAMVFHGFLSRLKPQRIIEIGSGFSSILALESTNFLNNSTKFTFIEPYPDNFSKLVGDNFSELYELREDFVQNIEIELFNELNENDILFIDSSHVAKAGSDVCHEVFRILPVLKPGVIVHFHDCFWPFEYPAPWIEKDVRDWNELYLLRAFMMYNQQFEILFFNHYFALYNRQLAKDSAPAFLSNPGGGLWLRRCGQPIE